MWLVKVMVVMRGHLFQEVERFCCRGLSVNYSCAFMHDSLCSWNFPEGERTDVVSVLINNMNI